RGSGGGFGKSDQGIQGNLSERKLTLKIQNPKSQNQKIKFKTVLNFEKCNLGFIIYFYGINTRHQKAHKISRQYPKNNPSDGDGFGCQDEEIGSERFGDPAVCPCRLERPD
ncbi:MAG: hypothetical protein U0938_03695, partial [Thiobacillus sp.]|nr:hypothetical protein [Thiobacillus sp.]